MKTQLPSKERLAELAHNILSCHEVSPSVVKAMAVALLAAHEQEPEWLYREHNLNNGMKTGWEILTQMQYDILKDTADPETAEFKKVFTHPAPSIPAAVPECGRDDFEKFCRSIPAGDQELAVDANGYYKNNKVHYMWKAWNACRAAMLNHSGDVTDKDEPVKQQVTLREGIQALRDLGGIDAEKILAERDALNDSDGWISVSERLPENKPGCFEYLVFETLNNRVNHDYWNVPDIGDDAFTPFWNHYSESVTHWQPLPAAPKG